MRATFIYGAGEVGVITVPDAVIQQPANSPAKSTPAGSSTMKSPSTRHLRDTGTWTHGVPSRSSSAPKEAHHGAHTDHANRERPSRPLHR